MVKLKVEVMKKVKILAILFTIFLIGCFASARHSKPLRSDPEGFGDVKWGTEIAMLKNMEKVEQDKSSIPDLVWYTRKGDTLAMGKAKLKNVFYSFWMGKFDSVWIDFEDDENFETLKKELFERFGKVRGSEAPMEKTQRGARGEPSAMNRIEGFYTWWGRNTEVLLSYSRDRHKGTLTINSTMISEERRAYEKQKEKEQRLKERGF
jgi:hypothetical protein